MGRPPFTVDPAWSFQELLVQLFAYYRGGGIQSTGYRLNAMRQWLSTVGRTRALEEIATLEQSAETDDEAELAESLWMSVSSWRRLKSFVRHLPDDSAEQPRPLKVFVSYKWESGAHVAWVRTLAADIRSRGIEAILDQWEVRLGDSFTDYMQQRIAEADVMLFVITPGAVAAAEAPHGKGGAVKFEVQMMNARRLAEGTRIIGAYRAGERPPHYLRDHRYIDFRDDRAYEESLQTLVNDLLGVTRPPPVTAA